MGPARISCALPMKRALAILGLIAISGGPGVRPAPPGPADTTPRALPTGSGRRCAALYSSEYTPTSTAFLANVFPGQRLHAFAKDPALSPAATTRGRGIARRARPTSGTLLLTPVAAGPLRRARPYPFILVAVSRTLRDPLRKAGVASVPLGLLAVVPDRTPGATLGAASPAPIATASARAQSRRPRGAPVHDTVAAATLSPPRVTVAGGSPVPGRATHRRARQRSRSPSPREPARRPLTAD